MASPNSCAFALVSSWALLGVISALDDPSWRTAQPVPFSSVQQLKDTSAGTYAWLPQVALNGTELKDGAQNIQGSFELCAASCSGLAGCSGFGFCQEGPCYLAEGRVSPQGACRLMAVISSEGAPAFSLASGSSSLGSAGVRILVERPDPNAFQGYEMLFAQALTPAYWLPCNGSILPNGCVVTAPLQGVVDRCSSWPSCQALVVAPGLLSTSVSSPLIALAGLDNGAPLNRSDTTLNPAMYTLVRLGWESPGTGQQGEQASDSDAGLSSGAIAGIVVGVTALAALAAATAVFVLRGRRRRRAAAVPKRDEEAQAVPSGGGALAKEGAGEVDAAAVWRRLGGRDDVSEAVKAVAGMFSEAQLADVIIPSSNIWLASRGGVLCKLGGGASGDVYYARLRDSASVAVKIFDFDRSLSQPRDFIQEAVMLRRLNHPHLVQFLGVSITTDSALCGGGLTKAGELGLLVMELLAGDLWSALQEGGPGGLCTWYKRGRRVAQAIASALQYLHSQNILHMDIKPQNVLLTRDGTAKVSDVGFSRIIAAERSHVSCLGRFGTLTWCAPEVLTGAKATKAADIYSYGIVLWQICTGIEPECGGLFPLQAPDHCPAGIAALQQRCCSEDPAQRPTAEEVVRALTSHAKGSGTMQRGGEPPASNANSSGTSPGQGPSTEGTSSGSQPSAPARSGDESGGSKPGPLYLEQGGKPGPLYLEQGGKEPGPQRSQGAKGGGLGLGTGAGATSDGDGGEGSGRGGGSAGLGMRRMVVFNAREEREAKSPFVQRVE